MSLQNSTTPPIDPDEPDLRGWDRDRDGMMADYSDLANPYRIERWNPKKDPVLKGLVASPYAKEEDDGS